MCWTSGYHLCYESLLDIVSWIHLYYLACESFMRGYAHVLSAKSSVGYHCRADTLLVAVLRDTLIGYVCVCVCVYVSVRVLCD